MSFRNTGTIVTITLSRWSCYGYDQRCEIFGDKGMVSVGNEHSNTAVIYNSQGEHHSRLKYSYDERFHQAYANELICFADTILHGRAWSVTKHDAIAVQRVAQAAKRASEMGRLVPLSRL